MDQFARMHDIYEFFVEMLEKYPIQHVGIEKLYFDRFNKSNAEFVYGVRGSLCMLFRKHTLPITEYNPTELKKNITGNGRAGKEAMQMMAQKLYRLEKIPEPHDVADALGLARLVSRK